MWRYSFSGIAAAEPPFAGPAEPLLPVHPVFAPGPAELVAFFERFGRWVPQIAVWLVVFIAFLGLAWLLLTLLLRVIVFRPRAAGRFTLSHAEELATHTLLMLVFLSALAAAIILPGWTLTALIPLAMCTGFFVSFSGRRGWFTWWQLIAEWYGAFAIPHMSRAYAPQDEQAALSDWEIRLREETENLRAARKAAAKAQPPSPPESAQLMRLRRKLGKVEAQLFHKSTHPHQREAARLARDGLLTQIAKIERCDR